MTFQLSPMQLAAADAVAKWYKSTQENPRNATPFFYLAGYAGSGKTSIAKSLVEQLFLINEAESLSDFDEDADDPLANSPFRYAAYTGKASLVLNRKGCSPASTIHSLIYRVIENETTREITFKRRDRLPGVIKLIIPDECSMINDEMANDLLKFRVPLLFLGDPGQLPPIDGDGFFTTRAPDFFLSEIHRQAAESPILVAATAAREGRGFPSIFKNSADSSVTIMPASPSWAKLLEFDQVLCGTNKLRSYLNDSLRLAQGYRTLDNPNPIPRPDEKLICTRNNWSVPGMVNGSMWKVVSVEQLPPETIRFTDKFTKKSENLTISNRLKFNLISWDDPNAKCEVTSHLSFFDTTVPKPKHKAEWSGLTQLDYGYAISVHKSQGSEWENVFLFNESASFRDNRKQWLYTAITRASKHLTIRL